MTRPPPAESSHPRLDEPVPLFGNDFRRNRTAVLACIRLYGPADADGARLLDVLAPLWDGDGAERAGAELHRILGDLIAAKRGWPRADLTTELLRHRTGLSDEVVLEHPVFVVGATATPSSAVIANALTVLMTDEQTGRDVDGRGLSVEGAGHQTLVDLISNAVIALLTRPSPRQMLLTGEVARSAAVQHEEIAGAVGRGDLLGFVNGHSDLPVGGLEIAPLAVAKTSPTAARYFPAVGVGQG